MNRQATEALDVRIVQLPPMRVAVAYGFGPNPESIAWDRLMAWAKEHRALDAKPAPRYFGFNNPSPTPGSPNYGYEQWMTVGPDATAGPQVAIMDFPGGLYAVTGCTLANIGEAWQRLVIWGEDSPYRLTAAQCLEECLGGPGGSLDPAPADSDPAAMRFDLYLAIAER